MPLPSAFSRLSIATTTEAQLAQFLSRLDSADVPAVSDVLVRAATSNGDLVLADAELKAVVDHFDKTGPVSRAKTSQALTAALASVDGLADAANVGGIAVHFSDELEKRLIGELDAAVARANGRPMDVSMMIFEFQSDNIEQAIEKIAKAHPEITFRIIGDSGQASNGGGNALPSLLKQKLPNVVVKYKKDYPYIWDKAQQRPVFNHGSTKGLNHHKGFVTSIDGALDRLVTGSFNWSTTANTKNYEDLAIVHSKDSNSRRLMSQFQDEFTGYFNNDDAVLPPQRFASFKRDQLSALRVKNGLPPLAPFAGRVEGAITFTPKQDNWSFDVNGYRPEDASRLEKLVGKTVAKEIATERERYGRFASFEDLKDRVKSANKQELAFADYGSGSVSLNTASQEELEGVGFSAADAKKVIAQREKKGDFDDVAELKKLGVTYAKFEDKLNAADAEAFFNSRPFSAAAGGTGYGAQSSTRTTAVTRDDGTIAPETASITWGANDMFNAAKKGDTISVAMYGMSPSSPESKALEAAAKRGCKVRVVVNDSGTDTAVDMLEKLRKAGHDVEVRIQRAKTMHEKFGVVGDDVFFGSANFSESSSSKHSENRVALKNQPRLARRFSSQFDLLWSKSKNP